jgi:hypothetical protein
MTFAGPAVAIHIQASRPPEPDSARESRPAVEAGPERTAPLNPERMPESTEAMAA